MGKSIEAKISEINAIGIAQEMMLTCPNPEFTDNVGKEPDDYRTFTSKVNFDPVNFFTAS